MLLRNISEVSSANSIPAKANIVLYQLYNIGIGIICTAILRGDTIWRYYPMNKDGAIKTRYLIHVICKLDNGEVNRFFILRICSD
jgi:hypothetical protein